MDSLTLAYNAGVPVHRDHHKCRERQAATDTIAVDVQTRRGGHAYTQGAKEKLVRRVDSAGTAKRGCVWWWCVREGGGAPMSQSLLNITGDGGEVQFVNLLGSQYSV